MVRALPNTLTLLNLIAGSCAIAALFDGHPAITLILALACLCLDVADGLLARRLNVTSELGVQLDSLADLVAFGVLPASILFYLTNTACLGSGSGILPYGAFLFAGSAALRLGRYNLDTREREVFFGLPTPSAATFVFGLLLMHIDDHPWWAGFCNPSMIYAVVLLLTLLMLTNLRLWSLKGLSSAGGKWILAGLLGMAIVMLLLFGSAGIVLTVGGYILFGLINVFAKVY